MRDLVELDFCVAILNFNGQVHLNEFLPKVVPYVGAKKIVIIDNGSSDQSITFIKENYSEIRLIELSQNYGFAGGYNNGLNKIEEEYVLLLNSDVALESDTVETMLRMLDKDPTIAAVQPTIVSYKQPEYYEYAGAAGGLIDVFRYPLCRGRIFNSVEKFNGEYNNTEIFWATGACMLIRHSVFKKLGGFAAYFFAHLEEIDLCWRMKRAGYKVMVETSVKAYHLGGGTLNYNSPKKTFLNFRNSLFTIFRNEKFGVLIWLLPARLVLDSVALLMFFFKGERPNCRALLNARRHYYRRLPRLFSERKTLQRLIENARIDSDRSHIGLIKKSIVYNYYIRSRKYYSDLF